MKAANVIYYNRTCSWKFLSFEQCQIVGSKAKVTRIINKINQVHWSDHCSTGPRCLSPNRDWALAVLRDGVGGMVPPAHRLK